MAEAAGDAECRASASAARLLLNTKCLGAAIVSSAAAATGFGLATGPAVSATTTRAGRTDPMPVVGADPSEYFCLDWELYGTKSPPPWTCANHDYRGDFVEVAAGTSAGKGVCAGVTSDWKKRMHHVTSPSVLGYRCGITGVGCANGGGQKCSGLGGYAFEHNPTKNTPGAYSGASEWL